MAAFSSVGDVGVEPVATGRKVTPGRRGRPMSHRTGGRGLGKFEKNWHRGNQSHIESALTAHRRVGRDGGRRRWSFAH